MNPLLPVRDLGTLPAVTILGVRVHSVAPSELVEYVVHAALSRRRVVIPNVNIHALNLAYELSYLRTFFNTADLVYCDGFGVAFAARLLGSPAPRRLTPPDWIRQLAQAAEARNLSLYFLGALPGVADKAAQRLVRQFPSLRVVGTHHGYFDQTLSSGENEAVVEGVNLVRPNILLVGLGMPLQERWLMENLEHLEINVALPVGALFDYLSGRLPRAPRWMTDHGLEWLGRLWVEPDRLWRRYLLGNPLFLWRVVKQRLGWVRCS